MRSVLAEHKNNLSQQLEAIKRFKVKQNDKKELNAMKQNLLDEQNENKKLNDKILKINKAVDHLKLLNDNFKKQLQSDQEKAIIYKQQQTQMQDMKMELDILQEKNIKTQEQNQALTQDYMLFQQELTDTKDENKQLSKQLSEIKEKYENQKFMLNTSQYSSIEQEKSNLNIIIDTLQDNLNSANLTIDNHRQQIQLLNEQLSLYKQQTQNDDPDLDQAINEKSNQLLQLSQLLMSQKPSGDQLVMVSNENLHSNFDIYKSMIPLDLKHKSEILEIFNFVDTIFTEQKLFELLGKQCTKDNLIEIWTDEYEELIFGWMQQEMELLKIGGELIKIDVGGCELAFMMACDIITAIMLGYEIYFDDLDKLQLMPDLKLPIQGGGYEDIIDGWGIQ